MAFKIALPRIFNSRFEGQHQNPFGPHFFGELIAGEGLAKAHFGVPEKARDGVPIFGPARLVIAKGSLYRLGLLAAHPEGFIMSARAFLAGAQLGQNGLQIGERAAHPLKHGVLKPFGF